MASADTEGSFIVERVAEMATAVVQHISSIAEKDEDLGGCVHFAITCTRPLFTHV